MIIDFFYQSIFFKSSNLLQNILRRMATYYLILFIQHQEQRDKLLVPSLQLHPSSLLIISYYLFYQQMNFNNINNKCQYQQWHQSQLNVSQICSYYYLLLVNKSNQVILKLWNLLSIGNIGNIGKFYTLPINDHILSLSLIPYHLRIRIEVEWSAMLFCMGPNLYITYIKLLRMSSNSSNQTKQVTTSGGYTKKAIKGCQNGRKSAMFLDETIFNKQLILGQIDQSKNAMNFLMEGLEMKKIRIKANYIEIMVKQNNQFFQKKTQSQNCTEFNMQNQYSKEYEFLNSKMTSQFQEFKNLTNQISYEQHHKNFLHEVKKMQHKNFICWFLPLGQHATQVNSIAISNKTLSLLGYTIDQACLQLSNFKSNNLNFLSNQAYFQLFWIYSNSICKFMQVYLNGFVSHDEVASESEHSISNQLIGKNQRRIKTEMKIWMPSPFVLCMQVMAIAKGRKLYDQGLDGSRKNIEQQLNTSIENEMRHIIKFAKPSRLEMELKRCSYIVTEHELE